MKIWQVLTNVKEFFAQNPDRWGKGRMYNRDTYRYCMVGQVRMVTGEGSFFAQSTQTGREQTKTLEYLSKTIPEDLAYVCSGSQEVVQQNRVIMYNDREGTRYSNILSWLDRAIDAAKADEEPEATSLHNVPYTEPEPVLAMIPAPCMALVRR